jgi:hypothetical protein
MRKMRKMRNNYHSKIGAVGLPAEKPQLPTPVEGLMMDDMCIDSDDPFWWNLGNDSWMMG